MKKQRLIFALFAAMLLPANAQDQMNNCYRLPQPEEIVADVKAEHPNQGHPRLMATPERFAELKQLINTNKRYATWYADVKERADKVLASPLPTRVVRHDLLENMLDLGFVYNITKEKKYAERAWKELEFYVTAPHWNPTTQFLDLGYITKGVAIGFDWFYDALTPEQRALIVSEVDKKAWELIMVAYQNPQTNKPYQNQKITGWDNWNASCNAGPMMCALAMCDEAENSELCGEVLNRGLFYWQNYIKEFYPDGACKEAVNYWFWGTQSVVEGIECLQTAAGDSYGYEEAIGFDQTPYFPLYNTGPTHLIFNFGNAAAKSQRITSEFFWFARTYNDPILASIRLYEMKRSDADAGVYDLLWSDSKQTTPRKNPSAKLPLNRMFRETESLTLRSDWSDKAFSINMKGGHNQATHGHLNAGTFVLDALGERWVSQLGSGSYSCPGYFSRGKLDSQGYHYYRVRAEGQNTLVINPTKLADQIPWAKCLITDFDAEKATASIDLTEAFEPYATQVTRNVALVDGKEIHIQDILNCKAPSTIWSFMHTEAEVAIVENGAKAILSRNGKKLEVSLQVKGAKGVFTLRDAAPLPTSPASSQCEKPNKGFQTLAIELEDAKQVEINVCFKEAK